MFDRLLHLGVKFCQRTVFIQWRCKRQTMRQWWERHNILNVSFMSAGWWTEAMNNSEIRWKDKAKKKFSGWHAFPLYSVCSCQSVSVRHQKDDDPSCFLMKNTVTCVYRSCGCTDSSVATGNLLQPNLGCYCFVVVRKRQCGVMWWRHEEQAAFPQHLLSFSRFIS